VDIKIKVDIGKIKTLLERQRNYYSLIAIMFLVITNENWSWWYLLIAMLTLPIAMYLDATYVIPKELDYWHGKSPVLKEILRRSK